MTKINLIKRQAITIDEFRSWLNQLIADKKGALPDMDDWKLIKEQLDKVGLYDWTQDQNGPGYSILQNDDDEYAFACGNPDEIVSYDLQFTLDYLDKLCEDMESEYNLAFEQDGQINQAYNEYVRETNKEEDNAKTKTESTCNCCGTSHA